MLGAGDSGRGASEGVVGVDSLSEESAAETSRLAGVRVACGRVDSRRETHDPGRWHYFARFCMCCSCLTGAR